MKGLRIGMKGCLIWIRGHRIEKMGGIWSFEGRRNEKKERRIEKRVSRISG